LLRTLSSSQQIQLAPPYYVDHFWINIENIDQSGRLVRVGGTKRDRVPVAPLLGTPDSRITSFEAGTTKSCATIPEDDEDESPSCERIDDLISIDRTTTSASEHKSHRGFYSHSAYNLILPVPPPEFQVNSRENKIFPSIQTYNYALADVTSMKD
uniref:Ras-associating domain-containing protein n=1 Tax=Heligmosomoides polygyrus TaxID=6339 RepID=A0A183FB00_HELPZ